MQIGTVQTGAVETNEVQLATTMPQETPPQPHHAKPHTTQDLQNSSDDLFCSREAVPVLQHGRQVRNNHLVPSRNTDTQTEARRAKQSNAFATQELKQDSTRRPRVIRGAVLLARGFSRRRAK
jgi:hypothetical protein